MTTVQDTVHGTPNTYKVAVEIDIDCEELVDACGLDYTRSEEDDTQNIVELELDYDEFRDAVKNYGIKTLTAGSLKTLFDSFDDDGSDTG